VKIPGATIELLLIHTLKFEIKLARINGENFAFLCQLAKGPSAQATEIIRHAGASFDRN
jgi:hypothetical protein